MDIVTALIDARTDKIVGMAQQPAHVLGEIVTNRQHGLRLLQEAAYAEASIAAARTDLRLAQAALALRHDLDARQIGSSPE